MRRRLEARAPVHAARREQRHRVLADEPADRLGEVTRVGVVGDEDAQRPLELLVEGREQQRQARLGDARPGRQRRREPGQPLIGAQALDERMEKRTVQDEGPERPFRGPVMVAACYDRPRLPSVMAPPSRCARRSTRARWSSVLIRPSGEPPPDRAPRAVEVLAVPGVAQSGDLHGADRVRRLDEAAVADVHADAPEAVDEDEVARPRRRCGRRASRRGRRNRARAG